MLIIKFSLGCATLLSEKMEKTRDVVEISKKREKSAKSKERSKILKEQSECLQQNKSYTCDLFQ